jgi:hypothetical protein
VSSGVATRGALGTRVAKGRRGGVGRAPEDAPGRTRTSDPLLRRDQQVLRSTAACRSGRSTSDGAHIASAFCCGLPLPPRFRVDPPAVTQRDSEVSEVPATCFSSGASVVGASAQTRPFGRSSRPDLRSCSSSLAVALVSGAGTPACPRPAGAPVMSENCHSRTRRPGRVLQQNRRAVIGFSFVGPTAARQDQVPMAAGAATCFASTSLVARAGDRSPRPPRSISVASLRHGTNRRLHRRWANGAAGLCQTRGRRV